MTIQNITLHDLPEVYRLYDLARDYQRKTFPENEWPMFDEDMLVKEIEENRQFKIVIDGQIACIWAIAFEDAQIWEELENDTSLYLHRIATNPEFRGNDFVKAIVKWSKEYSKENNLEFIRMDTCGDNVRLINHYKKCGFDFLGMRALKDPTGLPAHYHDADVCLFEIDLR